MAEHAHKRKLRNFLLDRRYQLKFTIIMVVIASALTAGLGYFWYGEMRKASEIIRINALANLGDAAADQVDGDLAKQDRRRLLVLAAFGVAFSMLLAGYGIVMTHKVAGPLFKITRHMNDIRENHIHPIWGLREGDQLQDFFRSF